MLTILGSKFPEIEFKTLADYPGAPEPDETADTYSGNAAIKAESACAFTGEWSLADDAGLEVEAMDGAPGLYSKRFEGEETPFPVKMQRILDRLQGLPEDKRGARFRCAVALARPGLVTEHFEGICNGRIAEAPSGNGGFGYDPIFWLPEKGCTMADLTAAQKHEISHRGKVLALVADFLEVNRAVLR